MGRYHVDFSERPYIESLEIRERISAHSWDASFNPKTFQGEFLILAEGQQEKDALDAMAIPDWAHLHEI